MHSASLKHITPGADEAIAALARVSNPDNQGNTETYPKLIRYLIDHKHWSPFEMVHATVEIVTTRDIGRQVLRHRSFSFQEWSGRYAAYDDMELQRECRFQDTKNRQNSIEATDQQADTVAWWNQAVLEVAELSYAHYEEALKRGVAKEQARALLPEGLVPTRMYMAGSIRSFIHYCQERMAEGVQKEHRIIAGQVFEAVFSQLPMVREALSSTNPRG